MALTPQSLFRAQDVGTSTVLGPLVPKNWRVKHGKTAPSTRANATNEAHPRYDSMTDWHGGDIGEDVGVADATQAIAGRNGGIDPDYEPRHQEEKLQDYTVPPTEMALDIGKDYGPYSGATYHAGTIPPAGRYPSVSVDETPESFRRSNYEPPALPDP